jgi:hypothetical protein
MKLERKNAAQAALPFETVPVHNFHSEHVVIWRPAQDGSLLHIKPSCLRRSPSQKARAQRCAGSPAACERAQQVFLVGFVVAFFRLTSFSLFDASLLSSYPYLTFQLSPLLSCFDFNQ